MAIVVPIGQDQYTIPLNLNDGAHHRGFKKRWCVGYEFKKRIVAVVTIFP